MKKRQSMKYLSLLSLLILVISCQPSNDAVDAPTTQQWYKGNLHTHSYWSDGDEFPEVIMDWYKSHDYQFVALSDHNTLAEGEKWITIREDSIYQNAFQAYLDTYGEDWVNHRLDTGRIQAKLKTYKEYKGLFEEEGSFLILQSEEITDLYEGKHVHLNATNIQEKIEPQGGNSVTETLQNNIDAVIAQREKTGIPMIVHINHPNFIDAIRLEDMINLKGERFFEVYNGHNHVQNQGGIYELSTEAMWDMINIAYLKDQKPIMYGLGTDDAHHYHRQGRDWSNAGRGWIMVQADTLSPAALIDAMEAGQFYASTGITLATLTTKDKKLRLEVAAEAGVEYTIEWIGYKKGEEATEILQSVKGAKATFELTEDLLFARCKITSTKKHNNPIEDLLYEMAWTQPLVH